MNYLLLRAHLYHLWQDWTSCVRVEYGDRRVPCPRWIIPVQNAALLHGEEAMQQVPASGEGLLGWFRSGGGPARPRQPDRGVRRTTLLQPPGEQSQ